MAGWSASATRPSSASAAMPSASCRPRASRAVGSSGRRWAALVGALSLRTRGVYFIMITLAFAQLVYYLASGLEGYGGDDGLNIGRSRFPGLIALRDKASFYWLCFALLCASLWFCGRLANSRFGTV